MMKSIAKVSNWHRYLLSFLIALDAVCLAISTGAVKTPEALHDIAPWAALANVFLVAFLPRFQLPTGEGAPPVISPKPADLPAEAVPLVPAFKVPTGVFEKPPVLVDGHTWETPAKPKA